MVLGNVWWRNQKETSSALLALCAGNSPVTDEFPSQRPVTRSFDGLFICAWINYWVNNREAGDLRRHCTHYDVTVMLWLEPVLMTHIWSVNWVVLAVDISYGLVGTKALPGLFSIRPLGIYTAGYEWRLFCFGYQSKNFCTANMFACVLWNVNRFHLIAQDNYLV